MNRSAKGPGRSQLVKDWNQRSGDGRQAMPVGVVEVEGARFYLDMVVATCISRFGYNHFNANDQQPKRDAIVLQYTSPREIFGT